MALGSQAVQAGNHNEQTAECPWGSVVSHGYSQVVVVGWGRLVVVGNCLLNIIPPAK